jgi:hypothetical protein
MTPGVIAVTPWAEAREQLEQAGKYWLATVGPNGGPHVMPVFGIWLEGAAVQRLVANINGNSPDAMAQVCGQIVVRVEGRQAEARTRTDNGCFICYQLGNFRILFSDMVELQNTGIGLTTSLARIV